jgi:hypothetical protein
LISLLLAPSPAYGHFGVAEKAARDLQAAQNRRSHFSLRTPASFNRRESGSGIVFPQEETASHCARRGNYIVKLGRRFPYRVSPIELE